MIQLIGSNNVQGYYTELLLKMGVEDKVKAYFPRRFNFHDVGQFVDDKADCVVIVGFGFKKNQQEAFIQALKDLSLYDTPMTEVYHFASWGDVIEDSTGSIHSFVDEELSPVKLLYKNFGKVSNPLKTIKQQDMFLFELVQAIDDYHTYTFREKGNDNSIKLKLLGDFYRRNTGSNIYKNLLGNRNPSVGAILTDFWEQVAEEESKMHDYLREKLAITKVFTVGDTVVVMLYAENYINEIANEVIEAYKASGYSKVVVMVGKQTRGDDMFSIRVSEGLDAGVIAQKINNGKGKERAATVFLGKPIDFIAKSVHQQLLT